MTIKVSSIPKKVESAGIAENQEKVRGRLAQIFAWGFIILTIIVLLSIFFGPELKDGRLQLINMLFNVISGLVGTVLGFYFGQNGK